MTVGTKSVLFGAHAFWLHPFVLALAWWRLFGFPWDPRLWFAFFLHDVGYLGKKDIDGDDGVTHPELGASIMTKLFGEEWGMFCLCHSRTYARRNNHALSKLAAADKYAWAIEPWWVYIPKATLSGEINEYMERSKRTGFVSENATKRDWYDQLQKKGKRVAQEIIDGKPVGEAYT